jgi:preprotein translocase subunit SecD
MRLARRLALAAVLLSPLSQAGADSIRLDVIEARVKKDHGQWAIDYRLTKAAAAQLAKFTTENIDKRCEIRAGGRILAAPVIRTPIESTLGLIIVDFSAAEAGELAKRLASGEAKLELEVVPKLVSPDLVSPNQTLSH